MGNWIGRHLKSDFDKNFENGKYPTTFNYVEYDPVNDQVTVDLSYIAISICLVFLYTPGVNQSGQRRRRDVDIPRTRVAATAATHSVETGARLRYPTTRTSPSRSGRPTS